MSAQYDMTPETFASYVFDLRNAGASFLGGCCGAGPDFVRMSGSEAVRTRDGADDWFRLSGGGIGFVSQGRVNRGGFLRRDRRRYLREVADGASQFAFAGGFIAAEQHRGAGVVEMGRGDGGVAIRRRERIERFGFQRARRAVSEEMMARRFVLRFLDRFRHLVSQCVDADHLDRAAWLQFAGTRKRLIDRLAIDIQRRACRSCSR